MSHRRLRDPNTLDTREPNLLDIRRVLIDFWYLISPHTDSQTGNYTTTGEVALETVICTNSSPSIVTLHPLPADGDEVIVKRQNAQVTIEGNGQTIDGQTEMILGTRYDSPHMVWTESGDEWSII